MKRYLVFTTYEACNLKKKEEIERRSVCPLGLLAGRAKVDADRVDAPDLGRTLRMSCQSMIIKGRCNSGSRRMDLCKV